MDNSAAYLAPFRQLGLALLDVGCGPGTIIAEFAHRLAPGRIIAIDPSTEVLSAARSVAENAGASVDFVHADIYDDVHAWAPNGERFDIVHAHQVLQHLPDPVKALQPMRKACVPGGLVAARHMLARTYAAGFTEISVIPEIWCFATDSEHHWWGSLWADRTRRSAVATAALERGLATAADLERIAAGWEAWSHESDAIFVVPHVAILCRSTP